MRESPHNEDLATAALILSAAIVLSIALIAIAVVYALS